MRFQNQLLVTFLFSLLFIGKGYVTYGQDPVPFLQEVTTLSKKHDTIWDNSKNTIVFTGSSSIRMWKNLKESFPNHQILNTGFGGSQASDLLYHIEPLVLKYNPIKVFIYEGDNDIFAKKRPKEIIVTTQQIVAKIKAKNPHVKIMLISAKPSISRWNLKGKYKKLNRKFERMAKNDPILKYVDVWTPMLNGRKLKKDIFISDGLHMNQKGYDLWYAAMKDLINKP
ncbi:SGNH/GDSL hydrolase family protein [Maribacter sp. CXY002]|uniref:SGNH/GDSL hydrolase family protein n=1 Tax=Maribacter luteocoastalis TaxID=3407671 RepID=UPI003B67162F